MSIFSDIKLARNATAAFVTVGMFWGTLAALVPAVKEHAGLSDGALGLAMLVAAAGALGAMWASPWLTRKLGGYAMLVPAACFALSFPLPGLAVGLIWFAVAMTIISVLSGTLDVVMNAHVSILEARHGRPLMNLMHALFSFSYAGSALIAGTLREAGCTPVQVLLFAATVSALLVFLMRIRSPVAVSENGGQATGVTSWPIILASGGIVLLAFLCEQGTEGWSALHLERNLGAGAAEAALGPAILGLTMGAGRLFGQFLAKRVSEARVIALGGVVAAAGSVTAAFAGAQGVAFLGFAVLGLGVSAIAPMALAWVGRLARAEDRFRAISRVSMIGYGGFFVGPPIMGGLSEFFGLQASFLAIALLMCLIPLLLVPSLKRYSRS